MKAMYHAQVNASVKTRKAKGGPLGPGYYFVVNKNHIKPFMKRDRKLRYYIKARVTGQVKKVSMKSLQLLHKGGRNLKKWPWGSASIVRTRHTPAMGIEKKFYMVCCRRRADFEIEYVKNRKGHLCGAFKRKAEKNGHKKNKKNSHGQAKQCHKSKYAGNEISGQKRSAQEEADQAMKAEKKQCVQEVAEAKRVVEERLDREGEEAMKVHAKQCAQEVAEAKCAADEQFAQEVGDATMAEEWLQPHFSIPDSSDPEACVPTQALALI